MHGARPVAAPIIGGRLAEYHAPARSHAPPDASAQLMQLGQPKPIRTLDHDDAGVRHVDPDLDHGRRHQHIGYTTRKGRHC